ncbi:MAG: ATP-binding protein [Lachnospiraceae bacterium]|nr:ATP-binding protein [Lachnospiraceae bacterium]MDD3615019.1 ATP-binding protein [Lachnospiraceae bacterium]
MDKHILKINKINIATIILTIFMFVLVIIGFMGKTDDVKFDFTKTDSFSQGWIMEPEMTEVTADSIMIGYGEAITITNTLPGKLDNEGCLGIYNNHFHIKIEINGKVIYNTGNHSSMRFGEESGRVWNIINLSSDYAYQPVRIMIENLGTERKFDFHSIAIGKSGDVYYSILSKNIGAAVVSFFAFVFSLLIIFYYLFLKSQKIMVASPMFLYLGLFSLVSSIWIFTDSDIMQFLFESASLRYQSSYFSFILLPLTMALFFREYTSHFKRVLTMYQGIYVGIAFLILVLYMTNILHISVSRVAVHGMIVVLFIMLVWISVMEAIRYKNREMLFPMLAFVIIGASGILNLFTFYQDNNYDNSKAFRIGFLIFIIILLLTSIRYNLKEYHQIIIEREIRRKEQAIAARNEFLAKMSHDMRTPLNGIIGLSTLAMEHEGNSQNTQRDIAQIQSSANYLLNIINDVLDTAKIESGKMELVMAPMCIEEIIKTTGGLIAPQAVKKNICFDTKLDKKLKGWYKGDSLRFSQIIMNLLSNALKYTPEGGKIVLEAQHMKAEDKAEWIQIIVKDNGIGMSEAFIAKIFEPFERETTSQINNTEGTGLGLSIVNNLVSLMNGTVEVKSKLGEGSSFIVCIPMERVNIQEEISEKERINLDDLTDKKVLLVEDHPLNRQIAVRLLNRKNMVVEIAENGQEGVERFMSSEPYEYQVILMDIRMPVMDGYQAARIIRNVNREDAKTIPIIAMTANAYEEDVKRALAEGMNDHLSKPIEPELLYRTIAKYLS